MADFAVIIPWRTDNGPRERIFEWMKARWLHLYKDDKVEFAFGDAGGDVFSRSRSRNELVARTTADVLVFADADTTPIRTFVDVAVEKAANNTWCIAYGENEYYNLTEKATEFLLTKNKPGNTLLRPFGEDVIEHRLTAWSGMLAVPRMAFQVVGGYDERFIGWGHEDVAFRLKLDMEFGKHDRVEKGFVEHFWHPREEATFDTPQELANRELFEREYRRKYRWRDERLQ